MSAGAMMVPSATPHRVSEPSSATENRSQRHTVAWRAGLSTPEQAYNRTLYGGVRKTRKVHADMARSILDRQHCE